MPSRLSSPRGISGVFQMKIIVHTFIYPVLCGQYRISGFETRTSLSRARPPEGYRRAAPAWSHPAGWADWKEEVQSLLTEMDCVASQELSTPYFNRLRCVR